MKASVLTVFPRLQTVARWVAIPVLPRRWYACVYDRAVVTDAVHAGQDTRLERSGVTSFFTGFKRACGASASSARHRAGARAAGDASAVLAHPARKVLRTRHNGAPVPEEDTDAPQLHRGHRLVTASQRDHGPAGVFGVWLTSTGAEVSHEPPEQPDVVLVTRTDALVAASGCDDLDGLERADIVGDREVVRSLMTRVRIPSSTVQH